MSKLYTVTLTSPISVHSSLLRSDYLVSLYPIALAIRSGQ